MKQLLVVADQQHVRCIAHIFHAGEQVIIEDILAERPIEAFGEAFPKTV